MRRAVGFAFVALALGTSGCRGWARVQAGGAADIAGRRGASGPVVSVDGVIGLRRSTFPLVGHTSLEALLAPERTSLGWGTGLGLYAEPRPIAPYVVAGSLLHVDDVRGRFSVGGVSPYGEVGLLTSVPARHEAGDGLIVSVGLSGSSLVNFLAPPRDTVEGFVVLKLGVGWEKN